MNLEVSACFTDVLEFANFTRQAVDQAFVFISVISCYALFFSSGEGKYFAAFSMFSHWLQERQALVGCFRPRRTL